MLGVYYHYFFWTCTIYKASSCISTAYVSYICMQSSVQYILHPVCMLFKSHLDQIFVTLMKVHCELFFTLLQYLKDSNNVLVYGNAIM